MEKKFSVHKSIVQNNREGFYLWAIKNNKRFIFDQVSKDWKPLESFLGDRIPLEVVSNEIKNMVLISNDPNLLLKIIDYTNIKMSPFYKVLHVALMPAFRNKIELPLVFIARLITHHFKMLTEVVSIELLESKNNIIISFKPSLPELFTYHQIEAAMLGIVKILAHLKNSWPDKVELQYEPYTINLNTYFQAFHVNPVFRKNNNQLIYLLSDKITLDLPIIMNPFINSIDNQFPDISYKDKIDLILCTTLGFLSPSVKNVAEFMNISVKTLQRRLNLENTNFNIILQEIRKRKVIEYLKYEEFTLQQISILLGYKAKSQFIKAFYNWFGMTPKEYKLGIFSHIP